MTKRQRISAFAALRKYLLSDDPDLQNIVESAEQQHAWYTKAAINDAMHAIGHNLTEENLTAWLDPYDFEATTDKTVGLIMAGNIPLVGFHDLLCTLCAGFNVQVKLSSDDQKLTAHLLHKLEEIEPGFSHRVTITERLKSFDLIIATGSDNSARYFEYYFGNKPNIIRKNRNSAAVLNGHEETNDLAALGRDIFDYFGLGCRNVSKVFFPKDYDVSHFFEGIASYSDIANHHKYCNNYDYNKSIYLINGDKHYDNGFLLVKADTRTASPLAVLYYEEYESLDALQTTLTGISQQLQCVVSNERLAIPIPIFNFGQSQHPALDDYADGVNTLEFLAQNK